MQTEPPVEMQLLVLWQINEEFYVCNSQYFQTIRRRVRGSLETT